MTREGGEIAFPGEPSALDRENAWERLRHSPVSRQADRQNDKWARDALITWPGEEKAGGDEKTTSNMETAAVIALPGKAS